MKMDNQHKKIKGYRDLSQVEIDLMNGVKELGPKIDSVIKALVELESNDKRWISIGKTDLQKGLMALVRSIAQPESF